MKEGSLFKLLIVTHNRDLNSKEEKIDWRSRLGVTMGEGENGPWIERGRSRLRLSAVGQSLKRKEELRLMKKNGVRAKQPTLGFLDTAIHYLNDRRNKFAPNSEEKTSKSHS